jgi:hypothetical protein
MGFEVLSRVKPLGRDIPKTRGSVQPQILGDVLHPRVSSCITKCRVIALGPGCSQNNGPLRLEAKGPLFQEHPGPRAWHGVKIK